MSWLCWTTARLSTPGCEFANQKARELCKSLAFGKVILVPLFRTFSVGSLRKFVRVSELALRWYVDSVACRCMPLIHAQRRSTFCKDLVLLRAILRGALDSGPRLGRILKARRSHKCRGVGRLSLSASCKEFLLSWLERPSMLKQLQRTSTCSRETNRHAFRDSTEPSRTSTHLGRPQGPPRRAHSIGGSSTMLGC